MDIPDDALRETWDSVYEMSVSLAEMIERHCRDSGERFDAMVVVPRGSYYPVNIISRQLGFNSVHLLHACIGTFIEGTTTRHGNFNLGQMPSDDEVRGKNLLIIEEVCDKGHTLKFLNDRLRQQGANLIRTGVMHYKPNQSETGFRPDWFVKATDAWIVYPWEIHEQSGKTSVVRSKN